MHRIDGANATADNRFSLGNPGAGIPATTVTADIMNALQEEVAGVIEASGQSLVKANNAQLLQAIRNLGFSTGDGKLTLKTVADTGWVMCNDGTIGSAASGATTRAHADTEALYTLLWSNVTNTDAPIFTSTGAVSTRGATAAADFAANKRLSLTKNLGRAFAMAGTGVGLTARALGSTTGAETHTLVQLETPLKSHTHGITDPGHAHNYYGNTGGGGAVNNFDTSEPRGVDNFGKTTTASSTGITVAAAASDAANPHNNMQPSSFWNAMIKL